MSSGRLLREYTVFLDPPASPDQAPIPGLTSAKRRQSCPSLLRADRDRRQEPPPASEQPPQPGRCSHTPSRLGEYGPVASGETLWEIASDWSRGSGMDLNKVMIAIQRENPNAFLRGNINLLKRGAILRMPQLRMSCDFHGRSPSARSLRKPTISGRKSAASRWPVPSTPLLAEETQFAKSPAGGDARTAETMPKCEPTEPKLEAESPDLAAACREPLEPTDQLELVPPSAESDLDSAYGFEESEAVGAQMPRRRRPAREPGPTEEELITQQQQNDYLEERIKELEAQLARAEEGNSRRR